MDVYDVRVSSRDHWDGKLGAGAGNGAPATTVVRLRSLIAWRCTAHPLIGTLEGRCDPSASLTNREELPNMKACAAVATGARL